MFIFSSIITDEGLIPFVFSHRWKFKIKINLSFFSREMFQDGGYGGGGTIDKI